MTKKQNPWQSFNHQTYPKLLNLFFITALPHFIYRQTILRPDAFHTDSHTFWQNIQGRTVRKMSSNYVWRGRKEIIKGRTNFIEENKQWSFSWVNEVPSIVEDNNNKGQVIYDIHNSMWILKLSPLSLPHPGLPLSEIHTCYKCLKRIVVC